MSKDNETPERTRERLRQKELKNNPFGHMKDGIDRAQYGSLVDLVGSLGWKGTLVIIVIIVSLIVAQYF
ncbi:DUF6366 family protein [Paenibacillus sp. MDMC362]|uniref:DUF6366 family protein n=1 Tax=Paenibacillus sp. MDMC362 TaxID=2977365 RepID=UPI000DC460C3|nr:DUF6366 family protein [Paenibacillus sp. MDMC362]RAR40657.1 hypothetical protein DP091_27685 [Paenibacillus sp. MDMC362]